MLSPHLRLLIATALANGASGPRYGKIRSYLRSDENGQVPEGELRRDEGSDRLKCLLGEVCQTRSLGRCHAP